MTLSQRSNDRRRNNLILQMHTCMRTRTHIHTHTHRKQSKQTNKSTPFTVNKEWTEERQAEHKSEGRNNCCRGAFNSWRWTWNSLLDLMPNLLRSLSDYRSSTYLMHAHTAWSVHSRGLTFFILTARFVRCKSCQIEPTLSSVRLWRNAQVREFFANMYRFSTVSMGHVGGTKYLVVVVVVVVSSLAIAHALQAVGARTRQ